MRHVPGVTTFSLPRELAFAKPSCDNHQPVSVEHELIRRALEGDGRAYAELVKPHLAMLYRVAARKCGSSALAEDAVQEALTLAYKQLGRYQPGTNFKAFLASIAVKRAHTLIRGERRRRVREDASDSPQLAANPAELLAAQRMRARIQAVLESLPDKRRQAALLRLDAGLSYAEIAEAVGTTEGSARVLVHMALKQLKAELKDTLEGAA